MDQPSSAPSSPIEKIPSPTQAGGHSTALLVAVSVLIGLLIGILGFLAWQKTVTQVVPSVPVPSTPPPANTTSTTIPETATSTPPASPTTTAANVDPTDASLTVQWKTGTIVVPSAAFGSIIPENTFRVRSNGYTGGIDEALPEYKFTYDYYEQGLVTEGQFKDHLVYGAKQLNREVDLGMDQTMSPEFFNLLVSPDKKEVRIIGMATSSVFGPAWPTIRFAPNLRLNMSSFPETLTLENGKGIRRSDITNKATPSPLCGGTGCVDRLPIARTQDGRSLYQGPTGSFFSEQKIKPGCVILYRENGEGMVYESGIASAQIGKDLSQGNVDRTIITTDQLQWNPAYTNTSDFRAHEVGGCGGIDCVRVLATDELKESDLVQAGQTKTGDPIYVYKPEADGRPRAAGIVYETYEQWYEFDPQTNQKPPISVFLQRVKVPVFFWKDALGRWVAYKNTIAVPLLECGKPVIYLYPTQTQNIHVKLPSFINVTVSDPTYPKEGWNVSAAPTGKLTLKDGTSVGSLFWEGLGVNYAVPKNGFVVKEGQVEAFLNKTLPQYGLNTQEQKDFMDFWVPLMTGAPYYRISFLTDDWSKQVPLSVTPMPRTNIRIFMDWQRLAGPIELPEPTITTPTRNGFTLVEWGGLLR